ncbi:MAG: cupin domain-containing protein [Robiginitomaculum sp.]|nr:cupin domain-containing protein [Robiginitomaculum sp.]
MRKIPTSDELIRLLALSPLPGEGGYFRRTYAGQLDANDRPAHSVIYYLLTSTQPFSELHWLPTAETYHFYLGEPVQMLILEPDKPGRTLRLGPDVQNGQHVQFMVPANCWHGSKLGGDGYALLGTTMTPGYMDEDYRAGVRGDLQQQFPEHEHLIQQMTKDPQ